MNNKKPKITLRDLKNKKISFISLGCDKNRVDLEEMMKDLSSFGFEFSDIQSSQIVIINTCAFILSARKEAVKNILEMVHFKRTEKLEKIIVTGCLPQRYLHELENVLPEVDKFVQIKDNKKIIEIIADLYNIKFKFNSKNEQLALLPSHYAYLKIADGCNNYCSYCTIPRIRGRYISKSFNEIVSRAKELVSQGAKELIIIAQDTTRYGFDLYGKYRLPELLNELSKIRQLKWIRLHYCYPELITDELLNTIKNNKKICYYIDVPFQHIDKKILKNMNRESTEKQIRELVKKLKNDYTNIAIRSTFIIGFPGETRLQFKKLCKFIKESNLDNIGFFIYSREEGTKAFFMKKQIFNFIKKARLKKIQKIQSKIADEKNKAMIGQTVEVLVDNFNEKTGYYEGRTEKMSPNIDFNINVEFNDRINLGEFYKVEIMSYKDQTFFSKLV